MRPFLGLMCPLLLLPLTACNPIDRVANGCEDADQAIVDDVMETADPDKVVVDRIEFVRAKVVDLPEDMQKFDFDQMMVITTEQWLTDSEATDRIPGIESPTTFVVNSSNDDVAPIDKRAAESFSLSNPVQKDPEWDDWVESITYTDPFSAVRDCADSH